MAVVALFAFDAVKSRENAFARAEQDTQLAAAMLTEHTARTFEAIDQALLAAIEVHEAWRKGTARQNASMQQALHQLQAGSPIISALGLVDADGRVLHSSLDIDTAGMNFTDRAYFQAHKSGQHVGLLVSEPVLSKLRNRMVITASRAIRDQDGTFRGVSIAATEVSYFAGFYASMRIGDSRVILLVNSKGTLIARDPVINTWLGRSLAKTSIFAGYRPLNQERGTFHALSPIDGQERIVSYKRVPKLDLYVGVTLTRAEVLVPWFERIALTGGLTAAVLILAALGASVLTRQIAWRERMNASLAAAQREAEQASRAKSDFLAHMSHELRTPLNAIIGFSDIMRQQMFGPIGHAKYADYARDIQHSGQHLLQIINQILDLSKVEAGKWVLDEEVFPLDRAIAQARQLLSEHAARNDVKLEIAPGNMDLTIKADSRVIRQIVLNLAGNAIKFSPAGGTVQIGAHTTESGAVLLRVADRGPGMAAEDIPRVLEPFGCATGDVSRARHETGLGLPLSKAFAELLGGSLTIESRLGYGTDVVVTLPPARLVRPVSAAA
ncbi:MAG: ATP-binding protein [Alphaproteobacteria bacterium]